MQSRSVSQDCNLIKATVIKTKKNEEVDASLDKNLLEFEGLITEKCLSDS